MKVLKHLSVLTVAAFLTACTSTVGNNVVNDQGQLEGNKLDWPKIEDATQEEGIFPNLTNLRNISKGMSKKELYYLIEHPHFSEMNGAREWNYIMKFKKHDGTVRICQYKVLFDDDEKAQSFYWLPKDCNKKPVEKVVIAADKVFVAPVFPNASALFATNQSSITEIKGEGKKQLDELAKKITSTKADTKIHLIGHTDYRGTEAYNLELSKKRAIAVKDYLVANGVKSSDITYSYKGESEPIKQCSNSLKGQALSDCLQPNRRVSVEITRDFLNAK